MNLISCKRIIDRYYSQYPFEWELNNTDAIEWMAQEIMKIGAPQAFKEVITSGEDDNPAPLEVTNYRVILPYDLVKLNYVRDFDTKIMYTHSTDVFHPYTVQYTNGVDYRYKIRGNYLILGNEEATLEINYLAMHVDDEGYPYIVDNEELQEALTLTLADNVAHKLWIMNKLDERVYREINRKRLFYRKSARGSLDNIEDKFEITKNMVLRLIPITHEIETSFFNMGKYR